MKLGCPTFSRWTRPRHFYSGWSSEGAHEGARGDGIPENCEAADVNWWWVFSDVFDLANGVSQEYGLAANLEDFT